MNKWTFCEETQTWQNGTWGPVVWKKIPDKSWDKESPSEVKQKIHETTTEQTLEETIQKSVMDTKQLCQ